MRRGVRQTNMSKNYLLNLLWPPLLRSLGYGFTMSYLMKNGTIRRLRNLVCEVCGTEGGSFEMTKLEPSQKSKMIRVILG